MNDVAAHIDWEFALRFRATVDWNDLYDYHVAKSALSTYLPHTAPIVRPGGFGHANLDIVRAWFKATRPDLSRRSMLLFGSYEINVEPIDVDGDGADEYLLDILVREGLPMHHLWLADGDRTAYTLTPLPFPSERQYQDVEATIDFEIGDFNNDMLPEFVIPAFYSFISFGYSVGMKYQYLLGWRDGTISLLTARQDENGVRQPFVPESRAQSVKWIFVNRDDDLPREWVQSESTRDNWACHWLRQTIFDWDGELYVAGEPTEIFDNSFNCALRRAEKAMEAHDYTTAIAHYEDAGRRFNALTIRSEVTIRYAAYAQERLAVAYAMSGRIVDTLALLEALNAEGISTEGTISAAMLAVVDPIPESLCKAAYDAMDAWIFPPGGSRRFYRTLPIKYRTDDYHFADYQPFPGSAENTACDYPSFLPPPTPIPPSIPEFVPTDVLPVFIDVRPVRLLIESGHYSEAVLLADSLLTSTAVNADEARYLHALAMELAGDVDGAAAQYAALYAADPQSPWSVLAAIHLASVQTN